MSTFLVMTGIVILLIGLSKGGLGGTLATLTTPLMVTVMPANQVLGLLLPILIVADIFAVAAHWQRWDRKLVLLLLPGGIIGVAVGTFFLASISSEGLRWGIGLIALLFVIYKLFENRFHNAMPYTPRNWHGLVAGSAAAVSSTLAHTGPPPVTIYLLMQNISPRTYVATSALFFAVLNWIKVPSYVYADLFDLHLLRQVVWLLPLLPLGVWLGKQISDKTNKVIFDRMIVGLLAISAIFLLWR